jgi:hypothetical protein
MTASRLQWVTNQAPPRLHFEVALHFRAPSHSADAKSRMEWCRAAALIARSIAELADLRGHRIAHPIDH